MTLKASSRTVEFKLSCFTPPLSMALTSQRVHFDYVRVDAAEEVFSRVLIDAVCGRIDARAMPAAICKAENAIASVVTDSDVRIRVLPL